PQPSPEPGAPDFSTMGSASYKLDNAECYKMEADPMADEAVELDELKSTHETDEINKIGEIANPETVAGPTSNVVPSKQQGSKSDQNVSVQASSDPELEDFLEQAIDTIWAPHPPVSAK
ncbi:hypothetical protein FRC10_001648, partial [Ceratobasidium sp. 414]